MSTTLQWVRGRVIQMLSVRNIEKGNLLGGLPLYKLRYITIPHQSRYTMLARTSKGPLQLPHGIWLYKLKREKLSQTKTRNQEANLLASCGWSEKCPLLNRITILFCSTFWTWVLPRARSLVKTATDACGWSPGPNQWIKFSHDLMRLQ